MFKVKIDGAIIVSTPQDLALLDVKEEFKCLKKQGKILGLIDNIVRSKLMMVKYKIFGEGGVKTLQNLVKSFWVTYP